jgi:hypothetical protein
MQSVLEKAELVSDRLRDYNHEDDSAAAISLLEERRDLSKEWELKRQEEQEVETARSQLEKEYRVGVKKIDSSNVSAKKKVDLYNKTKSVLHEFFGDDQKSISVVEETLQQIQQILQTRQQRKGDVFLYRPKQEKAVQPPNLSEIPLWRGSKRERMSALDFLKIHYGQYLSAFGAEQNNVFQDQLRAHDHKLVQGVINQLREEGKGRKVGDFVKTRSARVDQELKSIDPEYLREAHREVHRLKVAAKRRDPKS